MLEYFTLILICQLIGEFVVTTTNVPFPGPVVGMVLLFVFLLFKGKVPEQLSNVSNALLSNFSLLFVPAGVGVMVHFKLLGTDVWPLSVAHWRHTSSQPNSTLLPLGVPALRGDPISRTPAPEPLVSMPDTFSACIGVASTVPEICHASMIGRKLPIIKIILAHRTALCAILRWRSYPFVCFRHNRLGWKTNRPRSGGNRTRGPNHHPTSERGSAMATRDHTPAVWSGSNSGG